MDSEAGSLYHILVTGGHRVLNSCKKDHMKKIQDMINPLDKEFVFCRRTYYKAKPISLQPIVFY